MTARQFDPMLLAVLSNRFDAIVREMTNTLLRTGRSALLNTARDFSCAITDTGGRLVTSAEALPIHVTGSELQAQSMMRFHGGDLAPGDAFLHNDPYNGNTHHADYTILVPVYFRGRHMFTAIAKAHQADCGNSQPTTYASYASDIYEEGALNFPCVRIQSDYQDVSDIIRMCRARIRVPDQWYGDYLATLGAARIGEERLTALLADHSAATIEEFVDAWLDYSERVTTAAIRDLPSGEAWETGRHDPVPGMPDGVPLRVGIRIDAERGLATVDLRENIDATATGFNLSEACSRSAAIAGIFNCLPAGVPNNSGSFRRIEVLLREGCVAGIPRHPSSCSIATTNVADRIISITQRAISHLGDDCGLSEGGMGMGPSMGVISGTDGRTIAEPYINQLFLGIYGGPASTDTDGWIAFGVPVDGGLMYRDSIEILEQKYPVTIQECRLLPDSEGAGRRRGAPGCKVTYGPSAAEMTVAYLTDGHANVSVGVNGGGPAGRHDAYVLDADGNRRDIPLIGQIVLRPGELIVEVGGGGGGFGDPMLREPQRVLRDVDSGLVTPDRAQIVYGVALSSAGGPVTVDEIRTAQIRGTAGLAQQPPSDARQPPGDTQRPSGGTQQPPGQAGPDGSPADGRSAAPVAAYPQTAMMGAPDERHAR